MTCERVYPPNIECVGWRYSIYIIEEYAREYSSIEWSAPGCGRLLLLYDWETKGGGQWVIYMNQRGSGWKARKTGNSTTTKADKK